MSHHLQDEDVYIALLLPFTDGHGDVAVLGVYETPEAAQARCWRATQRLGFDQPTGVVHRAIGQDSLDDPPEDGSVAFEAREWAKALTEAAP